MLQAGIVGLPNVGKSTLFNALTKTRKAESANYPFCTIEPNVGVVEVPDARLEPLREIAGTNVVIPAAIEMVDIAGLVAGASKGEGLGNKFLANIREVDATLHVVRCFEDEDVVHTQGSVNPVRDIEIIETELILADLQQCENQIEKLRRKAKGQDKEAMALIEILEPLITHLNEGKPAHNFPPIVKFDEQGQKRFHMLQLLSGKKMLYACNVAEHELATATENPHVQAVAEYAAKQNAAGYCIICAQIEAELGELSAEDAADYLSELGVSESGVGTLIRATYQLLGLETYFTAGEQEVRAWTFTAGMKAPQCAGVIHGDFEQGFIKAEVVHYTDLVAAGSTAKAREAGKYRLEGKDYLFKDGDVALFRFAN